MAEWTNRPLSGGILARDGDGSTAVNGGVAKSIGAEQVARHEKIRGNVPDRDMSTLPKYMECYNRAQSGLVKIWSSAFNGVLYPEGATDDRSTWLQPGDYMTLSAEEAIFFFGDFMVPRPDIKSARDVIERYGGFQLEPRSAKSDPNDAPRIVGGPIGLPDIIVQPMDSRKRKIGPPIAIYDLYDRVTKHLRLRSTVRDPELVADEKRILLERVAEYQVDEDHLYDVNGNELVTQVDCDCSPIAHQPGVIGCQYSSTKGIVLDLKGPVRDPNDPDMTKPMQPDPEPEETKPPGGQPKPRR